MIGGVAAMGGGCSGEGVRLLMCKTAVEGSQNKAVKRARLARVGYKLAAEVRGGGDADRRRPMARWLERRKSN